MEGSTAKVATPDVVTLDNHFAHLSFRHRLQKIAINNRSIRRAWAIEGLEQTHHYQADNQPKRQILVKLIQNAFLLFTGEYISKP